MSKTHKVKGQPDTKPEGSQTQAPDAEPKAPAVPRSRGPKGTTEDAVITLISQTNPKRPNTKAFAVFSQYEDGMTIKAFADKVDALGEGKGKGEATANLVYDAKHGFISIAGYDPGAIVVPKVRVPKAKKEKAPKDTTSAEAKAGLEAETATEQMD